MIALLVALAASGPQVRKRCTQLKFCRRNYDTHSQMRVLEDSAHLKDDVFQATVVRKNDNMTFTLSIYNIQDIGFRVTVRPNVTEVFTRFDLSKEENVVRQKVINKKEIISVVFDNNSTSCEIFAPGGETLFVNFSNLAMVFKRSNEPLVGINLLEELNIRVATSNGSVYAREKAGERTDSVPYGQTASMISFHFNGKKTEFTGFTSREKQMNLIDYLPTQRPRLFNDDEFGNHGTIPFLIAHSRTMSSGLFWMNPTDTFLGIYTMRSPLGTGNHRMNHSRYLKIVSEGGLIDFVLFSGTYKNIVESYVKLTGYPAMAPAFAFGYHQARWNYGYGSSLNNIVKDFVKTNTPFDSLWVPSRNVNDVPFIVNNRTMQNVKTLVTSQKMQNRYLMRELEQHVPVKSQVYSQLAEKMYLVTLNNSIYVDTMMEQNCSWIDFLNADARKWWSKSISTRADFPKNVMVWSSMNEPIISDSIDMTMPKDAVHRTVDGLSYEHREIHNMYGVLAAAAIHEGLLSRFEHRNARQFVVSRTFFSGIQRSAWTWNGNSNAGWEHMRQSLCDVIYANLMGMPYTGADIGGFYKNPSDELFVRWFQLGAWCYPLFRTNSFRKTGRRDPPSVPKAIRPIIKKIIQDRYMMLPLWYNAMKHANETGQPIVAPLWFHFQNEDVHSNTNHVIVGNSLMVVPVLHPSCSNVYVTKPPGKWYKFKTGEELHVSSNVSVGLDDVVKYIRGGSVIGQYAKAGTTVNATMSNPLVLHIALDEYQKAEGEVYFDDGLTFDYQHGAYVKLKVKYENRQLVVTRQSGDGLCPTLLNAVIYGAVDEPLVSDPGLLYLDGTLAVINLTEYDVDGKPMPAHPVKPVLPWNAIVMILIGACIGFVIAKSGVCSLNQFHYKAFDEPGHVVIDLDVSNNDANGVVFQQVEEDSEL